MSCMANCSCLKSSPILTMRCIIRQLFRFLYMDFFRNSAITSVDDIENI